MVDLIETLVTRPPEERSPVTEPEAALAPVTADLAAELFIRDRAWLQEVAVAAPRRRSDRTSNGRTRPGWR